MDLLRWILLVVGLLLIGAIWYQGWRRRPAHQRSLFESARQQPADEPSGQPDAEPAPDELGPRTGPDPDFADPEIDRLLGDREPVGTARRRETPPPEPEPGPAAGDRDATPPPAPEPPPPGGGERATADDDEPAPASDARSAASDREVDSAESPAADKGEGEERIIVLHVMAAGEDWISGRDLRLALHSSGLSHGRLDIFHYHGENGEPVFSVANIIEPGRFDPETMDDTSTPGVALFARLPGAWTATETFDRMVDTARELADRLDARALDARRSTLTRQTQQALRDELLEYEHRMARLGR